jgi:hypothetical protein
MTPYRHREETLNTQLAIVLADFGLDAGVADFFGRRVATRSENERLNDGD